MLLSNLELLGLVQDGVIQNVPLNNINGSSIDIRLGRDLLVEIPPARWITGKIDLWEKDQGITFKSDSCENGFWLEKGQFVLGHSIEIFNLPNNISAEYKLKSSLARSGLEHLAAGWCLVGSTKIRLLDGTYANIDSLLGKETWVYSLDSVGEIVPGKTKGSFITKYTREIIRILLDNNEYLECTPEHKIMLRDGTFEEAQALQVGASLMSLYTEEELSNHKVKSIEAILLKTAIPVYDLTVDKHHNFAVGCGVFVHNCDPTWSNSVLTLEISNMSQYHQLGIKEGMKIGQMIFFKHAPVPEYACYSRRGKYNNDKTVAPSKGVT